MNTGLIPFRVKVCGVTAPDQVAKICATGIDAIGVNFSSTSSRGIGAAIARKIQEAKTPTVKLVGVFVNEKVERISELVNETPLDYVQLHGDESWDNYTQLCERIGAHRIIRACRLKQSRWDVALQFAQQATASGLLPAGILIDSQVSKQYGGTGKRLDWSKLGTKSGPLERIPIILAGGLTPDNVSQAIRLMNPEAVDVAGGVETNIGMKSFDECRRFTEQARWGWSPPPPPQASHFPATFN